MIKLYFLRISQEESAGNLFNESAVFRGMEKSGGKMKGGVGVTMTTAAFQDKEES